MTHFSEWVSRSNNSKVGASSSKWQHGTLPDEDKNSEKYRKASLFGRFLISSKVYSQEERCRNQGLVNITGTGSQKLCVKKSAQ